MKIQKIVQQTTKPNFGAGITNLYSDFDGTYIPKKYNHDSVCNHSPQVNKDEFQTAMSNTWKLFWELKGGGKEGKFNFNITTGRNLTETNYFLNKLRSQDLWVPLPDKLITCNGQDEFYLNVKNEDEFFKSDKPAFTKEKVNQEKREAYKESLGWDFNKMLQEIKDYFITSKSYDVDVMFKDKEQKLPHAISEHLSIEENEATSLLYEIAKKNLTPQEVRKELEANNKTVITPETKDTFEWYMGILSDIVHKEIGKHMILENIPTTRSSREYGEGLSLQSALEQKGVSRDADYIAFSDDGELGIRVAVSEKYKDSILPIVDNYAKDSQITGVVSSINKGSYAGYEVEIKPYGIDKFLDTRAQVRDIVENRKNDLVVVAGDGANDVNMLTVSNYVNFTDKVFIPANEYEAKQFDNIPLVSIYVDNRTDAERADKESEISKMLERNKYCNYDGRLRFIHVDPKDSNKPQTLDEAIKMAVASYAKVNEEFRKNLTPEIQKQVAEYEISYPQDEKIAEEYKALSNPEEYKNKLLKTEFSSIETYIENIIKASNIENVEDIALDENSQMDIDVRERVVYALAGMLFSLNSIKEKVEKARIQEYMQQYMDKITDTPKASADAKKKLMQRLIGEEKVQKVPEDFKGFIDKIRKRKIDPVPPKPVLNLWQKIAQFAKTKTGMITLGAAALVAVGGTIAAVKAKKED